MVSIQTLEVVEVQYGQGAHQGGEKVGAIVAGEAVRHALEGDEGPRHAKPIGTPPPHLPDSLRHVFVHCLIDDSLLYSVNLWMVFLECVSLMGFFFYELKGHADV